MLPDDGELVDEMTQIGYAARLAYEARRPRTHISPGYQGTLGLGPGDALGIKHALPDTPVVSINGDGGFMFDVQELATAVHHRIPVVFAVSSDNAFGTVRRIQQETYANRAIALDLTNPDFVKLAASFGVGGDSVATPAALRSALERGTASGAPYQIEVPVGDMSSPWEFIALPRVRGVSTLSRLHNSERPPRPPPSDRLGIDQTAATEHLKHIQGTCRRADRRDKRTIARYRADASSGRRP